MSSSMGDLSIEAGGSAVCMASGSTIHKAENRVVLKSGTGRNRRTSLYKPLAFLQACSLEPCHDENATNNVLAFSADKGESCVVLPEQKKRQPRLQIPLSVAATFLKPALEEVGSKFQVSSMKGFASLNPQDQARATKIFAAALDGSALSPAAEQLLTSCPTTSPTPSTAPSTAGHPPTTPELLHEAAPMQQDEEDLLLQQQQQQQQQQQLPESSEEDSERPVKRQRKGRGKSEQHQAGGASDGSASAGSSAPVLSEFEQQREANIRRNRERMMALQLPVLASAVADRMGAARQATYRGVSAKRTKPASSPAEPHRYSLRVRGLLADGRRVDSETNGVITFSGPTTPREPSPPKERHPKGPMKFSSDNGTLEQDAAMLELLKQLAGQAVDSAATPRLSLQERAQGSTPALSASRVGKLSLKQHDVAKVTKDGITHLDFHPTTSQLLVAAGDKAGKVSLWQVDGQHTDDHTAGVLMFTPHYEYISGLKWLSGHQLVSASYDGSLRVLDANQGAFTELAEMPADIEISAMDMTADGRVIYVGDVLGDLEVVDVRRRTPAMSGFNLHDKRINTIHVEPGQEQLLVTSSSDAHVCIWDVRKLSGSIPDSHGHGHAASRHKAAKGAMLRAFMHGKSCHAAYFAPDGSQRILSTSYDDTVRIWGRPSSGAGTSDPEQFMQLMNIKHNNQTGRWITPFRAVWGPSADFVAIGNMKRGVDVFNASRGSQLVQLSSDFMTAIPSRLCVHPQLASLAASTSSGRIHVFR